MYTMLLTSKLILMSICVAESMKHLIAEHSCHVGLGQLHTITILELQFNFTVTYYSTNLGFSQNTE